MDIGRRIREVREDLGMPQAELARRAGVASNTIYLIETGRRRPSVGLLEKIARELRTEPAELMRGPVPLAEALPAGGIPKSLEELLERRGARTRHLADRELSRAIRRLPTEDVIRIVREVREEVDLIIGDLTRLRASDLSDPRASGVVGQFSWQIWSAQIALDIRREQKEKLEQEAELGREVLDIRREQEEELEQEEQALSEKVRPLAGVS
jgi:transcriptional regulator with XRE-family HTH domain